MPTRRAFLAAGGALAAGTLLGRRAHAAASRPRSFIQVILPGGVDALLLTDAKEKGSVIDRIEIPYGPADILHRGPITAPPLAAGIGPELAALGMVNGVLCSTAAHNTGIARIQQLRMIDIPSGRDFVSVLGERLNVGQPLDVVRIGGLESHGTHFEPRAHRSLNVSLSAGKDPKGFVARARQAAEDRPFSTLDLLGDGASRSSMIEALGAQARRAQDDTSPAFSVAGTLLSRLPPGVPPAPTPLTLPPLKGDGWQEAASAWSVRLRDAMFVLRNRLAPVVRISDGTVWDTHLANLETQRLQLTLFTAAMQALFAALRETRTAEGGSLADEVGVLVCSEIGRFPIMNAWSGKDHLPELPVLFWGPGIHAGRYGETDERMLARPISFTTGRAAKAGRVPSIDDLAATVFAWFGVPGMVSSGYPGRPLEFLLA